MNNTLISPVSEQVIGSTWLHDLEDLHPHSDEERWFTTDLGGTCNLTNLLIGKAYTALLELSPGDEYEIELGRKQIRLVPVGGAEEEE